MMPLASCIDGNDWETDASHDRLFGVNSSKLSVETDDNAPSKATVEFTPYDKNGEYYIVELSTDTLTDDVPMGGTETQKTVVYGNDPENRITKSPVELSGLSEYTKYYLRVKVMSSTKNESKWVYYKSGASFRTPGVLRDVADADRLDTSVRLTWIAGTHATHIVMTTTVDDEPVSDQINLTEEDLAKAEKTVTGLTPNKSYSFAIYNGETLLGEVKLKTAKGMPKADFQAYLDDDATELTQTMLDAFANQALANSMSETATLAIGIPAGKTLSLGTADGTGGLTIPDGVSVTFFGRAGAKATLNAYKSMKYAAGAKAGFLSFEHVIIDGNYDAEAGKKGCEYLFNQSDACNVDSIGFTECEIYNLNSSLVRAQGGQTFNKLIIDNCIVNNHAGAYAFLCLNKDNTTINEISLTNSTFSNVAQNKNPFIDVAYSKGTAINISSCTLYNLLGEKAYFISAKEQKGDVNVNIYKTLFAKSFLETAKGSYQKDNVKVTASGSYYTSDFKVSETKLTDIINNKIDATSSEIFKKPAELNFTIKNSVLQNDQVGDPRWLK